MNKLRKRIQEGLLIQQPLNNQKIIIDQMKESIDIEALFNWLGVQIRKKSTRELRAKCPIHGGLNDTSLSFLKPTRTWKCWSKSCETEYGGDIIGLIRAVQRCSFQEAVLLLSQITGISIDKEVDEETLVSFAQAKIVNDITSEVENRQFKQLTIIKDRRSDRSGQEYFINRGLSKNTLKYFDVGGLYKDSVQIERIIIPVRDDKGQLIGIQGRRIDEVKDVKYRTEGFDKGEILYNLDRAKDYLGRSPTLILVEGVTDVWTLWEMDYYNVVSSLGVGLSPSQIALLIKYAMNIIVLFDGDPAGLKGFRQLKKEGGMGLNIYKIDIPDEKDPADVDRKWLSSELEKIYSKMGVMKYGDTEGSKHSRATG